MEKNRIRDTHPGFATLLATVETALLWDVRSHVLSRPAARQSFSYEWGVAGWGQ
jgi:hypothetical protein